MKVWVLLRNCSFSMGQSMIIKVTRIRKGRTSVMVKAHVMPTSSFSKREGVWARALTFSDKPSDMVLLL